MALDPRIPLMAQTARIAGPMENAQNAMQMRGMMQQNRLADFQMQQAQREAAEQDRITAALKGATPEDIEGRLYGLGTIKGIEAATNLGKLKWDRKKAELDYNNVMADKTRSIFDQMAADPSEDGVIAGANALVNSGVMDADKVDSLVIKAMGMPPAARRQFLAAQSNQAKYLIEQAFPKQTDFEKTLIAAGIPQGSPQWQQMMQQRAAKEATHAPPQSVVSFGEPKFLQDQAGNFYGMQGSNRGGFSVEPLPPGIKPVQTGVAGKGAIPAAALKLVQEEREALGLASGIQADLGEFVKQIDAGTLNLGLVSNAANKARNYVGMSTPESAALASFNANLEKMRNASLLLNKGVQTEGDAQRAWNELFENLNDKKVVKQRLVEISAINRRAAALKQMNIDAIYRNYNAQPEDTGQVTNVPAVPISGQKSFDSLPDPAQYSGQVATDQNTGTRYKSDGKKWNRIGK